MQLLFILSVINLILVSSNCKAQDPGASIAPEESLKLQCAKELISAANRFSFNFYKALAGTKQGNFIAPGYETFVGMSLAVYGAQGKTKADTRRLIQLPIHKKNISIGFKAINDKLETIFKRTDLITSMTWLYGPYDIRDSFVTAATGTYNAMVRGNVRVPPETTRLDIDAYFTCILENQANSIPLIFTNNSMRYNIKETVKQTGKYRYGELTKIGATFVEMPCMDTADDMGHKAAKPGQSISMFIILPNMGIGLQDLTNNIDKIRMEELYSSESQNVNVIFPKMFIRDEGAVKEALENMGLTVFSKEAHFRNVADKTVIDMANTYSALVVNPAFPVSGFSFSEVYGDRKSIEFTVNRPFISILSTKVQDPLILQIAQYTGP